ncbi:MAG: hypothetical protein AABZ00_05875 [Chloroflexota bacterium]
MNNPINNFNIESFQNQIFEEIKRLSSDSRDEELFNLAFNIDETNLHLDHRRNYPKSRRNLYSDIERELQKPSLFISKKRIRRLVSDLIEGDNYFLGVANEQLKKNLEMLELAYIEKLKRDEEARTLATKIIIKRDVRKYLCPALQTASNDAYDIAKIITPILIPLILAGTIAIPLQPLLFSHLALSIARMGIASLCDDFKDKDKK